MILLTAGNLYFLQREVSKTKIHICLNDFDDHSEKIIMTSASQQIRTDKVLGYPITTEPYDEVIDAIIAWSKAYLSKIVVVADIHLITKVKLNIALASMLHKSDVLFPDGLPLLWLTRWSIKCQQDRVKRMELFTSLLERATEEDISLFLLGATPEILDKLRRRLNREYPNLDVADVETLAPEPLPYLKDQELEQRINDSGAGLVFVALESPRQEYWMHCQKGKINAVMVGFGDAFSIFSGVRKCPFDWIKKICNQYQTTISLCLNFSLKRLLETL